MQLWGSTACALGWSIGFAVHVGCYPRCAYGEGGHHIHQVCPPYRARGVLHADVEPQPLGKPRARKHHVEAWHPQELLPEVELEELKIQAREPVAGRWQHRPFYGAERLHLGEQPRVQEPWQKVVQVQEGQD